jgi:hypothetical protein
MNTTSPLPDDELDKLFSDFFKSQLKQPWPKAPMPTASATASATAEPSTLVASRAETPRNTPAKSRDNVARARFTLAASVALMLGTCWYLSNDLQPGGTPSGNTPRQTGTRYLPESGATGGKNDVLDQLNKNKAKENGNGVKIDPANIE